MGTMLCQKGDYNHVEGLEQVRNVLVALANMNQAIVV